MRSSLRFSVISPILCLSIVSYANADWHLLRTDLTMSEIRSPRIERGMVHYLDQTGFETSTPLDQVFFVLPSERASAWEYTSTGSGTTALITLTDDQRLQALIQDGDNPDRLQFITIFDSEPRMITLEHLRSLDIDTESDLALEDTAGDVVQLKNNDMLFGFIESIGESVSIDTDGMIRTFQLDQTSFVKLANQPEPVPGTYLYLDQDFRLFTQALNASTTVGGSANALIFAFNDASQSEGIRIEFEPERFAGIDIQHASTDMVSLTSLTPTAITPTGDRAWTQAPSTLVERIPNSGLGDLDLKAPVQLRYTIGQPASRFACVAELTAGQWSDCELIVSTGSVGSQLVEIESHRLNPARDTVEISVDLPKGTTELIISIEPGINGPIQDRVILRKPRLLIEHPLPQFE